jgi:hypothetical protein
LGAAGLSELVTETPADYERLAVTLARDTTRLDAIRQKLRQNRLDCTLFDTDRFRRHIEASYAMMWDIWLRGEKPYAFSVGAAKISRTLQSELDINISSEQH